MNNKFTQIMKITVVIVLSFLLFSCSNQKKYQDYNGNGRMDLFENPEASDDERVADWVSRLKLEDKVNLVIGMRANLVDLPKEQRLEKVPGAAGSTWAVPSLGIPSMVLADGPAGIRIKPKRDSIEQTFYCTAFPIATALASTWNKELVYRVGEAIGDEAKEYGVDILLAPAMNIHRNPLAGRNFEYYSEDPYLSGYIGAAMINGVQSKGVGTSIKHFVANNSETNRANLNTIVSERALREIYFKGFEIAVREAKPWTVMSAYNKINGQYASESHNLLTMVLRQEWGFSGFVMTDWLAGTDVIAQMIAGNDLLMPGTPDQKQALIQGVKKGILSEEVLDRNVSRILKIMLRSPVYNKYEYTDSPDLAAHAQLARTAAVEGIILLKNKDHTLPFMLKNGLVAVYGIGSYDFISGGTGSGDVNEAYTVSLVEGIEKAGLQIDTGLKLLYEEYIKHEKAKSPKNIPSYMPSEPIAEMPTGGINLSKQAKKSAIALITIGRNSGEFEDRALAGDFNLTDVERALIRDVAEAYHAAGKKVVVLLNIGSVIETISWREDTDAIVLAWQGGQEAGNALADVLVGKANPSAKLPTTFPVKYTDVPSAMNFPGNEIPGGGLFEKGPLIAKESEIIYEEGIMVGYRYFSSKKIHPAYPFGFGLSYTNFNYTNLALSAEEFLGELTLRLEIENTGDFTGKSVAQLYISAPGKAMIKPELELKGFFKTSLLNPGESQTIEFRVKPQDLASFDEERSAWIAETGKYMVKIGSSCTDIQLAGEFMLADELVVEKVENIFKKELKE